MKGRHIARSQLGDLTKIGQGGQGVVYQTERGRMQFASSIVYKQYKNSTLASVNFEALGAMSALLENDLPRAEAEEIIARAAWPCAIVDTDGVPTGFVMPAIPDQFFISIETVKGKEKVPAEFQHLLNDPEVQAARGIALSEPQRMQLIFEAASALSLLHQRGITVGDVSPKNLLFATHPRPAVFFVDCDTMGIDHSSALPQMETPGWEVPAGESLATSQSDIFKLGLLALRMLLGSQDATDPSQLSHSVADSLRRLIADSLDHNPRRRPTAGAWQATIQKLTDNGPNVLPQPKESPHRGSSSTPGPVLRSRPTSRGVVTPAPKQSPAPTTAPKPISKPASATKSAVAPTGFTIRQGWKRDRSALIAAGAGLVFLIGIGFAIYYSVGSNWSAIAVSPSTLKEGWARAYSTEWEAKAAAMKYCEQSASDCRVAAWTDRGCVSLAIDRASKDWYGSFGSSSEESERRALKGLSSERGVISKTVCAK